MKKDPIQLQQRIIYYRAELDKYKKKVQDYQNNFHYSQLEKLKIENSVLMQEIEEWRNQETVVRGELSKRLQGFEERTARLEKQEERLQKEIQDWQKQNEELKDQKRDLIHTVKELEENLGEVHRRLSQSQKDKNFLHVSYVQVKKDFQKEKEAKSSSEQENMQLRNTLSEVKQEMEDTRAVNEDLEKRIQRFEDARPV